MLVEGCAEYGGAEGEALAQSVAQRWVEGNSSLLTSTGFMHEKYDAREVGGRAGGGGEYAPQRGFGWSNGGEFTS
jgi:alpha,alpha-trehalase